MARRIKIPGTEFTAIHTGNAEEADRHTAIITARHKFALHYMQQRDWGNVLKALSIPQIMEIREQPEWIDPLRESN